MEHGQQSMLSITASFFHQLVGGRSFDLLSAGRIMRFKLIFHCCQVQMGPLLWCWYCSLSTETQTWQCSAVPQGLIPYCLWLCLQCRCFSGTSTSSLAGFPGIFVIPGRFVQKHRLIKKVCLKFNIFSQASFLTATRRHNPYYSWSLSISFQYVQQALSTYI